MRRLFKAIITMQTQSQRASLILSVAHHVTDISDIDMPSGKMQQRTDVSKTLHAKTIRTTTVQFSAL
jgi:hypothetical protein